MPVDFLSETQRAAGEPSAESSRRPRGNCASYGTRTLGLRKSSCSRSEALSEDAHVNYLGETLGELPW